MDWKIIITALTTYILVRSWDKVVIAYKEVKKIKGENKTRSKPRTDFEELELNWHNKKE